jgi:hypothetical protein
VAKADEFERLFGHLAIGQNPTPKHNRYLVMKWDFSKVRAQGDIDQIQRALYNHLNNQIQIFATRYQDLFSIEITIDPDDAISSFERALMATRFSPYRLYLLIDEYDNFANELMMGSREISQSRYQALLSGEGILKTVFKAVKAASSGEGLERVFLTGISPVVLSDITSGYNIADNIYLFREFNDLCGFSEPEIANALTQVVKACHLPPERAREALALMRTFYDGYCFYYSGKEFIYNPTLALYFLKTFQHECQYPRQMLDGNLALDRAKLAAISSLPNGEQFILNALNEAPPLSVSLLADRFGVSDMLYAPKDSTFLASLLYYFGVLTLNGETPLGKLCLTIPNLVVRKLYVERIFEMLLPQLKNRDEVSQMAETFYQTGDMPPLCDFIEHNYFKVFDNRDYKLANELILKTAFLTLLFNDAFYMMESETELVRGYADLTLIVRPEMRQYQLLDFLIEFKYVKFSEAGGLTGEQAKQLTVKEVKELAMVQEKLAESKTQLKKYRAALESKYGKQLRLQTYSVIALGFERMVWWKVNGLNGD